MQKFFNLIKNSGLPEITIKDGTTVKPHYKDHIYFTDNPEVIEVIEGYVEEHKFNCVTEEEYYTRTNPDKLYIEHLGEKIPISYARKAIDFARENGFKDDSPVIVTKSATSRYKKGVVQGGEN